MIEELEKIASVHISDIYTIEDCLELINMYGSLFSVEDKAENLISAIKNEQNIFREFVKVQPQVKTAYFIWKDPWMVAANNTFINTLMRESKFKNYFEDIERYPEIDINKDLENDLEVILLSTEPYPFKESHVEELQLQFPKVKVKLVDGELFSWYGSRLAKSYPYFKLLKTEFQG
jgi:ABC-type Fe3+-hydroxamate transport system substrate-binding protein